MGGGVAEPDGTDDFDDTKQYLEEELVILKNTCSCSQLSTPELSSLRAPRSFVPAVP